MSIKRPLSPHTPVNAYECMIQSKKGKELHFSWITDLQIHKENVYQLSRGGRARWHSIAFHFPLITWPSLATWSHQSSLSRHQSAFSRCPVYLYLWLITPTLSCYLQSALYRLLSYSSWPPDTLSHMPTFHSTIRHSIYPLMYSSPSALHFAKPYLLGYLPSIV